MKKTLLSVVIPVYNGEKSIGRTLDSLIAQDFQNFEIVVINDGSTDTTEEILWDYSQKDTRVKVYSYPNGGVTLARKRACDHINGEFVLALDADDTMVEGFLTKLSDLIQKHPMLDVIRYKAHRINDFIELDPDTHNGTYIKGVVSGKEALRHWTFGTKHWELFWLLAIRKELYVDAIVKCPEIKTLEDLSVIPGIIFRANHVAMLDEYGTNYHIHTSSLMHTPGMEKERSRAEDFLKAIEFVSIDIDAKNHDFIKNYIRRKTITKFNSLPSELKTDFWAKYSKIEETFYERN